MNYTFINYGYSQTVKNFRADEGYIVEELISSDELRAFLDINVL